MIPERSFQDIPKLYFSEYKSFKNPEVHEKIRFHFNPDGIRMPFWDNHGIHHSNCELHTCIIDL